MWTNLSKDQASIWETDWRGISETNGGVSAVNDDEDEKGSEDDDGGDCLARTRRDDFSEREPWLTQ